MIPELSRVMKVIKKAVSIITGFSVSGLSLALIPERSIMIPVGGRFSKAIFGPCLISLLKNID